LSLMLLLLPLLGRPIYVQGILFCFFDTQTLVSQTHYSIKSISVVESGLKW